MRSSSSVFGALLLILSDRNSQAFQNVFYPDKWVRASRSAVAGPRMTATARAYREDKPNHFLLEEFCTHEGEVVNPYDTLNVARECDRSEVRKAYIALSKRYHPDGVRHKDILPGKCNDLDDVREEWERIKLSYEILSDKKTRRRYDRHVMIADPQAAMGRAAIDVVGKGISGIGQGILNAGAFAVQQMTKDSAKNVE